MSNVKTWFISLIETDEKIINLLTNLSKRISETNVGSIKERLYNHKELLIGVGAVIAGVALSPFVGAPSLLLAFIGFACVVIGVGVGKGKWSIRDIVTTETSSKQLKHLLLTHDEESEILKIQVLQIRSLVANLQRQGVDEKIAWQVALGYLIQENKDNVELEKLINQALSTNLSTTALSQLNDIGNKVSERVSESDMQSFMNLVQENGSSETEISNPDFFTIPSFFETHDMTIWELKTVAKLWEKTPPTVAVISNITNKMREETTALKTFLRIVT